MVRQCIDCGVECRSVDPIAIDLLCLAPTCEGGGISFHCVPVITHVGDMLVEPRAPLVLVTVSCMDFLEDSCHFVTYDASERCLVKTPSE